MSNFLKEKELQQAPDAKEKNRNFELILINYFTLLFLTFLNYILIYH